MAWGWFGKRHGGLEKIFRPFSFLSLARCTSTAGWLLSYLFQITPDLLSGSLVDLLCLLYLFWSGAQLESDDVMQRRLYCIGQQLVTKTRTKYETR